ncbi:hypothetical protein PQI51_00010 [Microbacterium esteraromaticum]|jgi:hypothetical protein|uniref:hypothetical protein n=1 Tax=Microbacterium esteraromaticum TaxID=57043 RepID=UPI0030A16321
MVNWKTPNPDSPWTGIVGPCYTTASLARTLGWTEAMVSEAVHSLSLLRVTTSDGVDLYPAFQIWDGKPVGGLADVLRVLRTGVDSQWTWAQWLSTPLTDEDGVEQPTNVQRLREGQLADVLREAKHDAAVWRS